MATQYANGRIVTDGLVLNLNAADPNSYPRSGTTWTDISGNGNNGALTNGPTFSGANGGSIVLDGSNNYINVPHSSTLSITNTITIDAWIYVTSANYNMIVTKQPSNSSPTNYPGNYEFRTSPTNALEFYYQVNTADSNFMSYTSVNSIISLNTWINVCCVAGGISYGGVTMYVNNIPYSTTSQWTPGNIVAVNTNPVLIGRRQDGYYFNGRMASVKIYNRLLSASEVAQNYNAQKARFGLK